MREIIISEKDSNRRLDKFLTSYLNAAPYSLVNKWLRKKRIKLNGSKSSGGEIISAGDKIIFYVSESSLDSLMIERQISESPPVDVVHEDDNIVIVNKPAGLLTHSASANDSDCLVSRVLYHLKQNGSYDPGPGATFTPAACNRLDRNTSGIVIFGKTLHSLQEINAAIADGKTKKIYLAVVDGIVTGKNATSSMIIKNIKTNTVEVKKANIVGSNQAKTEYECISTGANHSYLKITIVKGKPHQIRAHLASEGHPVAGDRKYGGRPTNYMPAQLLHAHKLFYDGKIFTAPPPDSFTACVNDLCK
ncbi:MAG: RluA family pseudouridine synthase [Defluviitaleaceae bacterium]|nr:RluA family pseudouridine synthase [Defluviitaleaceae bacterium]